MFVAIEIKKPGEFPNELSSLSCFYSPIVKGEYFTRDQVASMLGKVQKIQVIKRGSPQIDLPDSEILEQDYPSGLNLVKLLDWLSAKGRVS